jgi:hypothetical protein
MDFKLVGEKSQSWNTNSNVCNPCGRWQSIYKIGGKHHTSVGYFDGYMAEIHFIDGTAKAASDFGEYNDDGVWIPKEYSGAYGTNGFYLKGQDSSALGDDTSGNGNDFSSSGLAAADQMSDSPTDNYCVLSPIDKHASVTLSDGNLVATAGGGWYHGRGTLFAPSGKWYYEWTPTAGSYALAGWMTNVSGNDYEEEESDPDTTYYRGVGAGGRGFRIGDGSLDTGPANFSLDDVVMMAIDVDTMKMWVGVNGTWYNSGDPAAGSNATGTWSAAIGKSVAPWYGLFTSTSETFNFGQRPFAHTIPTGFNSWNTSNLPAPTIKDGSKHFNTALYTGNSGTALSVTGLGFKPDWLWAKPRSLADNHRLQDIVRGSTTQLISNSNGAEFTQSQGITSFDSDGFTVGTHNGLNNGTNTYVAWNWLAGNTTGSSNTDGDITSTVTANTTSGFSIVTYSGNGSDNQEIGHGIGIAPKMIITKRRDASGNWTTYHDAVGINKVFYLNSTSAPASNTEQYRATPTSSVYTIGVGGDINNSSGTYVAYVFAEVPGYSSIGGYTGNGNADGVFVYTGFSPSFIMYKVTSTTDSWEMYDTKRRTFNPYGTQLKANLNNAETDDTRIDILSNGFKARSTNTAVNGSGATYIYMAFAENPFGGDGVAPVTAR